jgi:hypothetical protein
MFFLPLVFIHDVRFNGGGLTGSLLGVIEGVWRRVGKFILAGLREVHGVNIRC